VKWLNGPSSEKRKCFPFVTRSKRLIGRFILVRKSLYLCMSDSNRIGFLEVVKSISLKAPARFGGFGRPINSTLEAVAASI